jgi:hypothetical protein
VFLVAASGVRDRPRGAGRRQPLMVKIGGCGGGFILIDVGISTSYEVRHVEKSENEDGDVYIQTLMRRRTDNQLSWETHSPMDLGRVGGAATNGIGSELRFS